MLNFFKKNKSYKLEATVSGNSINIEKVNDSMFSKKLMGDGIAIIPNNDIALAPCDGKILYFQSQNMLLVWLQMKALKY